MDISKRLQTSQVLDKMKQIEENIRILAVGSVNDQWAARWISLKCWLEFYGESSGKSSGESSGESLKMNTYKGIDRKPKIGDWIRFFQSGNLVIGVVAYIRDQDYYPYETELCTDIGVVGLSNVREVR